jgi:protein SCO1/2
MNELNAGNRTTVPAPPTTARPTRRAPMRMALWSLFIVALFVIAAFIGWLNRPPELHGVALQSPRVADDFTLMTSHGELKSLSDFRGQYVVLYFGYTFCPDVCPTTMNDLKGMAAALGETRMQDVQVILISVDPERDTPEQLATYTEYFYPSFLGMTGTVAEIQAVASQFGIFFERQPGSDNTAYLVDHTSAVTVIDPEGYVRIIFPYGVSGEEMATDLGYFMRRG